MPSSWLKAGSAGSSWVLNAYPVGCRDADVAASAGSTFPVVPSATPWPPPEAPTDAVLAVGAHPLTAAPTTASTAIAPTSVLFMVRFLPDFAVVPGPLPEPPDRVGLRRQTQVLRSATRERGRRHPSTDGGAGTPLDATST